MRIVLYTGKGGVGKTCVSASAALAAARAGQRTVILSSDRAHSLGDCFQRELGPDPTPVAPNLDALETDPSTEIDRHWAEIQRYLRALMTSQGVDSLLAEEIAMIPGLEEGSALLRLQDLWDSGDYDALIVDCAPTGATLRLLSLPEAFGSKGIWIGMTGIDKKTKDTSGYGIHSTSDAASIGTDASEGCIRVGDDDIDLVYAVLYENHSTVEIRP